MKKQKKKKKKWLFWLSIDGEKKLITYLKFATSAEILNLKLRSLAFRYWSRTKDSSDKHVLNITYLWIAQEICIRDECIMKILK